MTRTQSAATILALEPFHREEQTTDPGTWEIRPRTGEHVLSARSRELLGVGPVEPISIRRLLAALHPADRDRWKDAVAEVLDPERSGQCEIEFRAGDRWLSASARAVFNGLRTVRVFGTLHEVSRKRFALSEICKQAIDEAALAHPGHPIEFERWDEPRGEWDRGGLLRMFRTLLENAIEHGAPGEPVTLSVIDCGTQALIAVLHHGEPTPDPFGEPHFNPRQRGVWPVDHVGLQMVREIVRGSGGRIEMTSDESATVFHVWLPKGL